MCHPSLGGSVQVARTLAQALGQRGYQVHLITPALYSEFWEMGSTVIHYHIVPESENSIRLTHRHPATLHTQWSAAELTIYTQRVCEIIATESLELLHFHYAVPFAQIAARVRTHLGQACPLLVGTLHGTDVTVLAQDSLTRYQLSQDLGILDSITTVSQHHAQLSMATFDLPMLPKVIPNFVDVKQFCPKPPHQTKNRPRLVHVSNFRPIKNPQAVAQIFLNLRRHMDTELWLIGSGPELPAVQALLEDSGYGDDVRYWGIQTDVAFLLQQTDLMLITSRQESFGMAALEAMGCGVPVLATNVGGLPELVIDGVCGALFPLEDLDMATNAAIELLTDRDRYQQLRQGAIAQAQTYDQNRIIPLYEELYSSL